VTRTANPESPSGAFDTPIALSVYARAHLVRRLVAALRPIRPRRILVFADGPHPERPGDDIHCGEARDAVAQIDWPCDIAWNVSDTNLGARARIQSGLAWVFDQVEEAIVFEEDCIPDPTFLPFCRELLARYRDDPRVLVISGMAWGMRPPAGPESYQFATRPRLYGWAAWRRTWAHYEPNVESWPALRPTSWLREVVGDRREAQLWEKRFDLVRKGFDTWDYSLTFSCWKARGLSIIPRHDLVENVGFGPDGTHTLDANSEVARRRARSIAFPLVHPPQVDDWWTVRDRQRVPASGWAWDVRRRAVRETIEGFVARHFGPAGRSGRLRSIFRGRTGVAIETLPPVGTALDFTDDRAVRFALVRGWSFAEQRGRWTIGMQASVAWRLDDERPRDLTCCVDATPALHASCPTMTVDLFVNDRLCATSIYGSAGTPPPRDPVERFRIPRACLAAQQPVVLTFFVRWPFVPADHDVSDDFRALGLFVHSIRFPPS